MKKYRFKIGDNGLARAWVSLRFRDKTVLSRCLIDTGANVVAVSSALALTLDLPKLGEGDVWHCRWGNAGCENGDRRGVCDFRGFVGTRVKEGKCRSVDNEASGSNGAEWLVF